MAKNLTRFVKSIGGGGNPLPFKDQHIFDWVPTAIGECACNYGANWVSWCVPPGISTATFHIWGAGGYPGGGNGCGVGIPSSSGAYAYKSISVTPGECYAAHVGVKRCCFAYNVDWQAGTCRDSDHGTTYVVGTGLTNFCAEGGYHSGFVCCDAADFASTLFDSATPYYTCGDSAGGPNRACYYGADNGVRGEKGYVTTNSLGINTALCNMRYWTPLPGCSSYSKLGGHVQVASCVNDYNPVQSYRNLGINMDQGYCVGVGITGAVAQNWEMAGMGAPGFNVCGGTTRCGGLNNAGKIRILFSQQELMAKNLTQFAPGMIGDVSIGQGDWQVQTFRAGNGCHTLDGTRTPNYGGNGFKWTVPTGITQAKFFYVANGSNPGGTNCCMTSVPGSSGSSGILDVSVTEGEKWCFCTGAGGCCVATEGGQQGCQIHIYNDTNSEYFFKADGAMCTRACCNMQNDAKCFEVCYGDTPNQAIGRCFEATHQLSNISVYGCAACSAASAKKADFDSDENVFKSRQGFTVTSCCSGPPSDICGSSQFADINHFKTNLSHYAGAPMIKTGNQVGGSTTCAFMKMWGGTSTTYGMGGICTGGTGGMPAIAEGGNCYCGGGGQPAFITIWYKQC